VPLSQINFASFPPIDPPQTPVHQRVPAYQNAAPGLPHNPAQGQIDLCTEKMDLDDPPVEEIEFDHPGDPMDLHPPTVGDLDDQALVDQIGSILIAKNTEGAHYTNDVAIEDAEESAPRKSRGLKWVQLNFFRVVRKSS
jgi:hypothetical protein